jgi:hypothetical protein
MRKRRKKDPFTATKNMTNLQTVMKLDTPYHEGKQR